MSKSNSFNRNNSPYTNTSQKDLSIWEWEDVNKWLQNNNMQQYLELFQKYEVNGYDLCYLTNEDLNEMQLTNFHDRNLVLKNIRLMTLDQLKIQITHEEKTITVQLDFDPNFTAENLVNSLMELFKIQTGLIFMSTYDNEILMPNLKLVDLILLNPKKYKSLKIHSSNNFSDGKKYESKTNSLNMNEGYVSYNVGQANVNSNINTSKQKSYDRDGNQFTTFDKEGAGVNDLDDFQYKPRDIPKETDDLLLSSKNPLDDYSYTGNNKDLGNEYSSNTHSYKNYTSYKENPGITGNTASGVNNQIVPTGTNAATSLKTYENSLNSITNKYKDSSKIHNDTYDELKMNKNKVPLDRFSYTDDKDSVSTKSNNATGNNSSNPGNNFISITDNFNYDKNSQKGLNREKDDYKNIGNLTGTPVQNNNNSELTSKYNYSERLKEDLNRQKFSSEKRNFRNNQYVAKADEKVDDFTSLIKNDNNKFEKLSEKFSDKSTEKFSSRYNAMGGNSDFNSIYSEKDNTQNNGDLKSKVNNMRSQLNGYNGTKNDATYKFNGTGNRENLNPSYNQNSDAEMDSSNPRKLNRNNSTNYAKLK